MPLLEVFTDPDKRRYLSSWASWLAILTALFLLRNVLLPFILAALLAYVLDPAVSRISSLQFRQRYLPRSAAVLLSYIALSALFYLLAIFFVPQLYKEGVRLAKLTAEWVNSLDETTIRNWGKEIDDFLMQNNLPVRIVTDPAAPAATGHLITLDLAELIDNFTRESVAIIRNKSAEIVGELQGFVTNVLHFVFNFILVFMLAAFILVDTRRIRRFAFSLVPKESHGAFSAFLKHLNTGISGVVRGQLIICFVNSILTLVGLLILKVKFALILATLAGILSIIPIFGSILSTIPIALIALMKSPSTAFLAICWIVFIHALEANFLNPKIMGKSAKIHPVLVVLALVAGEHYFGIAGALLAVPAASIMLNTFNSILIKAQT